MGTEAFWVPAVMSLVAAGGTAYNTKRTADKQDARLAAQLRAQGEKQREADARTAELVRQRAQSDDTAEREGALGSFLRQMQANRGNVQSNTRGATSQAYQEQAADAALGAESYGQRVADLLSRIDAPALQRQNEAAQNIRYGDDIGAIQRRSAGDDFLHQMRLRGIRRNPWIDLGAGALQGMAGSYGSWGGGSAPTGATGSTAFGYGSYG